jgi:hypothetical protein
MLLILAVWTILLMSNHVIESKKDVIVWSTETRIDFLVTRISKLELAMKALDQSTQPRICKGNVTSDQFEVHNAESDVVEGLRVQVDTSACQFTHTPTYFATVSGKWAHWALLGSSAIYTPTSTQFVIYLGSVWPQHQMSGQALLSEAQNENYKWQIDWVGID